MGLAPSLNSERIGMYPSPVANQARGKNLPFWLRPFVAIERARGRQRLLLILIGLAVLSIPGSFIARHASLASLPDIGDPFDVNAFRASIQVPDDQNAMVLYRKAVQAFQPPDQNSASRLNASKTIDYGTASPELKASLDDNRPALGLWLEGTNRPDCLTIPVAQMVQSPWFPESETLKQLAGLALLESTKLIHDGDMAGAWIYLRGVLRYCLHLTRHAPDVQLFQVMQFTQLLEPPLTLWVNDARTPSELLHQAVQNLNKAAKLQGPVSDTLKLGYISALYKLQEEPETRQQALNFQQGDRPNPLLFLPGGPYAYWLMKHEPERSLRTAKLVYANWLSQCDQRPAMRAPMAQQPNFLELYDTALDLKAPAAAKALDTATLYSWYESTIAARQTVGPVWATLHQSETLQRLITTTRLTLATRLYTQEVGPNLTDLEELVRSGYLDQLPPEYAADGRPLNAP